MGTLREEPLLWWVKGVVITLRARGSQLKKDELPLHVDPRSKNGEGKKVKFMPLLAREWSNSGA